MDIEKILKEKWKSLTKERKEIFSYMEKKHIFSSNDILENFPKLWRASSFRTINLFLEIWILRRIFIWERWENYEINEENHHHEHMKCEKCLKVINFNSDKICKDVLTEAKKLWFSVKEHSINIIWTCSNCL